MLLKVLDIGSLLFGLLNVKMSAFMWVKKNISTSERMSCVREERVGLVKRWVFAEDCIHYILLNPNLTQVCIGI